ncbi:SET domain containing 3 [Arctopsyche grandis]|uniref:SET domain containing 3 n=1 Tax=Arctopsyche grandis TaxID=121162 RepID=UPI00406D7951
MGRRGSQWKLRREHLICTIDQLMMVAAPPPSPTLASNTDDVWQRHLQLRTLTETISELETTGSPGAPPPARLERVAQFTRWLSDNGVDLSGIEITEFPNYGLGLKATKSFTEGENIINIPRKLIMTEDSAKKSILGAFINKDPILKLMPNIALVMYLLLTKFTPNSFWKPYIDILPTSYDTVLYFSLEDLEDLRGTPNFKPALKLCQDIARQYAYFFKQLQNSSEPVADILKKVFTYKEYCWAVSTVMTRLNMVPSETIKDSPTTALIPLWDMCNHTNGQITTHFNMEQDRAESFALKNFNSGDQILIFYGVRTNAFFFLHNGFVYEENDHDAVTIILGISPNDPLQQLKRDLLEKLAINYTQFQIVNDEAPITPDLLAFSRVFVMDKDNLTLWSEGNFGELLDFDNSVIDSGIEKKAYNFINMRCKLLLNTYERKVYVNKMGELSITGSDDINHEHKKNNNHRLMVKKLKETEMKLLRKAIDFTQPKL